MPHMTFAANHGALGGAEVVLLAMAEAARDLGWSVTVVAPRRPHQVLSEARKRGLPAVGLAGTSREGYLTNLRRWDEEHRQGWLWCNGLRPALATTGRRRRIVHLHHNPGAKLKALSDMATRDATKLLVPSNSARRGVPQAEVMRNWTEPLDIARPEPGDVIKVGYIGRAAPEKGILTLCNAMKRLEAAHPGRYSLVYVGDERFGDDIDHRVVREALREVPNLDNRPRMSRAEFFSSVDVLVSPSEFPETFGIAVSEAMSVRCPVVVSDAGALPETVGPAHPWVFRAGNSAALADAISNAVSNPERGLEQAFERWQQNFSPAAGRSRMAKVLTELSPPRGDLPRVALVHDYLTQRGGAERVVLSMLDVFPEAEIVTSVYDPANTYPELAGARVTTSPMNWFGGLRRRFRLGLPFYGRAFERSQPALDADVLLISTTGYAHGIRSDVPKVVYCHSPARFLYLVEDYLGKPWYLTPKGWVLMAIRPGLVRWDQLAARSAAVYLTNSTVVQQRIRDVYGIESRVLHPPYGVGPTGEQQPIAEAQLWPEFHVIVARLMPYKNIDVVIEAFRGLPGRRLLIIGSGPMESELRKNLPDNVVMVKGVSDEQMRWAYSHATAVMAPSKEDFGLTPVEGFSFGTPTLALRAGGYLDTVVEGVSGYFFDRAEPQAVRDAIAHLDRHPIDEATVLKHAEKFSPERFSAELHRVVSDVAGKDPAP